LKALGVGWYRRLVEHTCDLARYGEALLRERGFEVLCPTRLSIVCFRLAPPGRSEADLDRLNLALVDAVRATGRALLPSTGLGGRVAMRFCFINWRTRGADVEEVVALLAELGARLG